MDCSRAQTRDPAEWLVLCPECSAPLADRVREWILTWAPDLEEAIKWNMLCFSGRKLVLGLSACRRHLGVSFFRGTELADPAGLFNDGGQENTHIRSVKLTTLDGLDRAAFRALVEGAVALDADLVRPPVPKVKRPPWPMPDCLAAALRLPQHRAAAAGFRALSPSCQREYLVWLSSARRPETRERRLAETLAALAGGRRWADRKVA